jgi:hypothetical protein
MSSKKINITTNKWNQESFWDNDSLIDDIASGKRDMCFPEKDKLPLCMEHFYSKAHVSLSAIMFKLYYNNIRVFLESPNYQRIWDSLLESHASQPKVMNKILNANARHLNRKKIMSFMDNAKQTTRYVCLISDEKVSESSFVPKEQTAYLITKNIDRIKTISHVMESNYIHAHELVIKFHDLIESLDESVFWKDYTTKDFTMFFFQDEYKHLECSKLLGHILRPWVESFFDKEFGVAESLFNVLYHVKALMEFSVNVTEAYPEPMPVPKKQWVSVMNSLEFVGDSFMMLQERCEAWLKSFSPFVRVFWKVPRQLPFIKCVDKIESYDQTHVIQNIKEDYFRLRALF